MPPSSATPAPRRRARGAAAHARPTRAALIRAPHAARRPAHAPRAAQFKLQCRELGINRWNYRKLRSLAVLEAHLREHAERERLPDGTVPQALLEWNQRVQEAMARGPRARGRMRAASHAGGATAQAMVNEDPSGTGRGQVLTQVLRELEVVRQWDVKYHYNSRKRAVTTTPFCSDPPAVGASFVASGRS